MTISIIALLGVSIIMFFCAIIKFVLTIAKPYHTRHKKDFNGINNPTKNIMHIALFILGAVWAMRLAVGLFIIEHPNKNIDSLPVGDQIVNSLLHALMSFSMDEDFTNYLKAGKDMIAVLLGETAWLTAGFSIYSAFLNVAAPIAGGAIIFDIIAELSPQFHFLIAKLCIWREKYYFTALNEQSLSLAKDIVTSKNFHHSTIIFTDAYADDENEESSERLLRAKAIGAICLKDDLLHISMHRSRLKTVRIFLSDRKENDNLEVLSRILSWKKRKRFKKLELYVFSSDRKNDNNNACFLEDEVTYIYNRMLTEMEENDAPSKQKLLDKQKAKIIAAANKTKEKQQVAQKKANNRYEKKEISKFPVPRVVPINGVRNMAQNLFYQIPLFEGLYGKNDENKTLRLTIFGSGIIGMEIFLNAYWIGQMLDVVLEVTVVSQESEESFKSRLDYLNPEILRTLDDKDDILDVRNGECKDRLPYLKLSYLPEDVMSSEFMKKLTEEEDNEHLIDSDYFVVALGSDEDNFTVADKLRQSVGYYHLNNEASKNRKTIISYVIYNSALCRNLNRKNRHDNVIRAENQAEYDVYMHAFGSMDDVYSMNNIMFEGIKSDAESMGIDYQRKSHKDLTKPSLTNIKTWRKISTNYYNYRSDIARRLHIYYKAYSVGFIKPSLFHTKNDEEYWTNLYTGKKEYAKYVTSVEKTNFDLLHKLAWLEHRRWCAFMRICGFRFPEDFERYFLLDNDIHEFKDHKFIILKLHPCLVESGMDGIHADLDEKGFIIDSAPIKTDCEQDLLDEISLKRIKLKGIEAIAENDFKRWDYPECDTF